MQPQIGTAIQTASSSRSHRSLPHDTGTAEGLGKSSHQSSCLTVLTGAFRDGISGTRLLGHTRISTSNQDTQLQLDALVADGVQKRDVFADVTSGSKSGIERPGMRWLLENAEPGDTVVVRRVAEYEREVIVERATAGIAAARQSGTRFGRPFSDQDVIADKLALASDARARGRTAEDVSRFVDWSQATLYRHQRASTVIESASI